METKDTAREIYGEEVNCENCENSGIAYIPDSTGDDFDLAYCYCPEGRRAELRGAMEILRPTMKVLNINWESSEGSPVINRK